MEKFEISSARSLVIIMACVVVGATFTAVYILYLTAFSNEAERLVVTAKSQARLIEAMARFNQQESADFPGGSFEATLSQIRKAHESYLQFGDTGEFTLAMLEGAEIVFLLSFHLKHVDEDSLSFPGHGHTPDGLLTVTVGSGLAEPMELALKGQNGTIVGKDYLGNAVLAAYEPVDVLNLGIVAKINLAEIRAPYIRAWGISSLVSLTLIAIGTILFGRITYPMIERTKESEELHSKLFTSTPSGVVYQDSEGKIIAANPAAERILGLSLGQMQGRTSMDPSWHAIHEDGSPFSGETHPAMLALRSGETIKNVLMGVFNPQAAGYSWISINAVPQFKPGQDVPHQVYTTFDDITVRKAAEESLRKSEERFDLALSAANDGLWDWDITNDTTYLDQRYYRMAGYEPHEFPGTYESWAKRIHPDDLGLAEKAIQAYLAGQTPKYEVEFRFRCKDGKYIWIRANGKIVSKDESGTPLRMVGTHADITDRKRAEDALRESEERFHAAFDHANTGMALVDLEGNIFKANAKLSEIFGYSTAELENMNVNDFTHPDDKEISPRLFEKIKPGKVLSTVMEKRYIHKNGKLVHGLISIGAVKDPEGIPQYIISQIQDITERKQAEAELVEARNQAEEANLSKSRFLANMSHELRTPLAIVNGSAEILLEDTLGSLTEKQNKFVRRIHESGEHLLMIINDLLDLAKIEAGKLVLELDNLDLAALSRETYTMIGHKAQDAGLKMELEGMDQVVLYYGDRLRLKQVLLNLLSNALKFTKTGTITTYLKSENGTISWGVRDTGIGIKEELLDKLFQPFEQGEEVLNKEIKGTGLGLALSRQIILAHGGDISVKSEFGQGADFRIVLPATKPGENN